MAYTLSIEQMASITDPEVVFSTVRLLPAWELIPDEFKQGNIYTRLASSIFYGDELPDSTLDLNEGVEPEMLNRCIRAHLMSFGPEHSHKIAGVGYMIACAGTLSASTRSAT